MIDIFTLFFAGITLLALCRRGNDIPRVSNTWTVLLVMLAIAIIYWAPEGFDKLMYRGIYESPGRFKKDAGWETYNAIYRFIIGSHTDLFFLIHDIIYTYGFVYFAYKTFPKEYIWYYLLIVFISMGYYSGGTNVMRSGFAISLIFYGLGGLTFTRKSLIRFGIFASVACTIHLSTAIIVSALVVAYFWPRYKWYIVLWLIAVVLSYINALGEVADFMVRLLGDDSKRLTHYMTSAEAADLYRNAGFRFDFVIYSLIPIIIGLIYLVKFRIDDRFYAIIFCGYIIINAVWLVVIRIPFADRFALMSWVFIPLVTCYPALKCNIQMRRQYLAMAILLPTMLTMMYILR